MSGATLPEVASRCIIHGAMFTLPNLITIGRVLLIPVVAFLLLDHDYRLAFAVFAVAAVGDWVTAFSPGASTRCRSWAPCSILSPTR